VFLFVYPVYFRSKPRKIYTEKLACAIMNLNNSVPFIEVNELIKKEMIAMLLAGGKAADLAY
jgi:hypothetical protein